MKAALRSHDDPLLPGCDAGQQGPGKLRAPLGGYRMTVNNKVLLRWVLDNIAWFILIILVIVFSLAVQGFRQWGIYRNILYQAAFVGILAIGEAMCIIVGEIDLSIESVLGLCAVTTAWLTASSSDASGLLLNGFLALLVALAIGSVIGLINGLLTVKLRISSFIITLAGYLAFRALGLVITGGHGITRLPPELVAVANTNIGPVPLLIIVLILLYLAFYGLMTKTKFGLYLYLVGDNAEACFNAGIRVDRVRIFTFVYSGLLGALAGWLIAARVNGSSPGIGTGMLFEALAAVVIGGVSLKGGVGKLSGVFAGVLILSTISTSISLVGMNPFYVNIIRGGLIIFAVVIDALISRIRPALL